MTVEIVLLDLDDRVAVVRAADDGTTAFPHVLRGTLAAMLAVPTWHVVVAFDRGIAPGPHVTAVLDHARDWADERGCELSVVVGGMSARAGNVRPAARRPGG